MEGAELADFWIAELHALRTHASIMPAPTPVTLRLTRLIRDVLAASTHTPRRHELPPVPATLSTFRVLPGRL